MRISIITAMGSLLCLAATAPMPGPQPLIIDLDLDVDPLVAARDDITFGRREINERNARDVGGTIIFNEGYSVKLGETNPDEIIAELDARDNPTSGEIVSIDEVLDTTISAPVKREHLLSAELKNLHDNEKEIFDNRSLMSLND